MNKTIGHARLSTARPVSAASTARPAPRLNGRTASLVWAYWGDDDLTTMGQETMKLKRAMEGYDHKVLLKHQHTPSWLDFSEGDERRADVIAPPTPQNFTREMVRLAREGYIIDVFINAHGDLGEFQASRGTHGSRTTVTAARIRDLPAQAGLRSLPIRAVYQTQCYASSLNDDWRAAGAKVSTGARHIIFYPNSFGNYMRDWNDGKTVRQSNAGADSNWVRTQAQVYILADAKARKRAGKFDGCSFGNTVLGKKACAKEYFVPRWLRESEWRDDLSGKQNMNHSSAMITSGSRTVTKQSRNLSW